MMRRVFQVGSRGNSALLKKALIRTSLAALTLAIAWSCGDSNTGIVEPGTVSLQITADVDPPIASGAVTIASAGVRLTRTAGGVALDTVVTLTAAQNPLAAVVSPASTLAATDSGSAADSPATATSEVDASVTEPALLESTASSVAASPIVVNVDVLDEVETFVLGLTFYDAAGQALFSNQPTDIVVRKNTTNNAPLQVVSYVGPGISAAQVVLEVPSPVLFVGNTMVIEATALDDQGHVIPNVPFVWSSPDPGMVTVNGATGSVVGGPSTGEASIVATVHSTDVAASTTVPVKARPAAIVIVSGANQAAPVGTQLPELIRARVQDGSEQGIAGVPVAFSASSGGQFDHDAVVTDATGLVEVLWTLGATGGTQTASITIPDVPEVSNTVTATAYGEAATLEIVSGNAQTGIVGNALNDPLVVRVIDDGGNPVIGQQVDFVVMAGGGTVVAAASETDAAGTIQATWTLGTSTADNQAVLVQLAGQASAPAMGAPVMSLVEPATFTATPVPDQPTTLSFSAQPGTATAGSAFSVAVTVQDQYGNRATGVTGTSISMAIAVGSGAAGAVLSGTNPVTTVAGIATFNNLAIDLAGTGYVLEATATGLTTAMSSSFDVNTGGIATIEVTPAQASATAIGQSIAFTAVARDVGGNELTGVTFTWSSNPESVAIVDASGLVTAQDNGTAQITASAGGASGSATIDVSQVIDSIVVTPAAVTLTAIDATQQYSAEAWDANDYPLATQPTFTWGGGGAVATVSASGLATADAEGTTQITATADGVTGSASLTVAQVIAAILVTPGVANLEAIGATQQFAAEAQDANGHALGTQPAFNWDSDDELVATIDAVSGLATAEGEGTTLIGAGAGGIVGTATLSVGQAVASIVVNPGTATLSAFGATQQFTAEARDGNNNPLATQPTFIWSENSSGAFVTIDANGLVTAQGNGTAQVTASAGGASGSASVTVSQTISSIVIDPPAATLTSIGATQQFTAEARDANDFALDPQPAFTWSGGGTVATVDANGLATADAEGTAQITASAGGVNGSADLTVTQAIGSIVVTPATVTLNAIDATQQFNAEARDGNGTPLTIQPSFTWSSGDDGIATVNATTGLATAEGNGTTQITASAAGVNGSASLTVTQVATSVVVTPNPATLTAINATQQFVAEARDANNNPLETQPTFTWSSNNHPVAIVGAASGVATAQSEGTAEITATGAGLFGSADLTVTQVATSILVTPATVTFDAIGAQQQFTAEARDANDFPLATQPAFTWGGGDTVATVDVNGLATAIGNGTTQITVNGGGATGAADFTVAQVATSIVVTPAAATLNAFGATQQFAAEARDANDNPLATQPAFTWSGGDTVATVDANGLATAIGNGPTQVTASGAGLTGNASLTVAQVATSVIVSPDPVTLDAIGATQEFSAVARDANDSLLVPQPASFDWASSDEAVATVDPAAGATTTATAAGNGTTQIEATTAGVTGFAQLTVDQEITEIVVTPGPITLNAFGATQVFSAEARDVSGNPVVPQPSFSWSSTDTDVATVDPASGATTTATAKSNGVTQIEASASGLTGSAELTVDQTVTSIVVSPAAATLNAFGATQVFSAEARDANDSLVVPQPSFNWLSTETDTATVSPAAGLTTTATAVGNGVTQIQATVTGAAGVTGTADLTVAQTTSSVVVTPSPVTMDAFGLTQEFAAEARDANGNALVPQPTSFDWISTNGSVATVAPAAGATTTATSIGNGTTQIQATTGGVPGSASLTVAQVAISVEVTPASVTLITVGDTVTFKAVTKDANDSTMATQPSFTWSSSEDTVATINPSTGLATVVGTGGTTTITATGGGFSGTAQLNVAAVTIAVTPLETDTLDAIEHEVWYSAEASNAGGSLSPQPTFVWSVSNDSSYTIVNITATDTMPGGFGAAQVQAMANGTVYLVASATVGATVVKDSAAVTVQQKLDHITLTPASVNLTATQTQSFSAEAFDRNDHAIATQPTYYSWASLDPLIATVDSDSGLTTIATAVADGLTSVTATSDTVTGSATVRVGSLTAVYWDRDPGQQPHWNIGANWSSGMVPTASDDVVIDLPGTYRVDIINSPAVAKSVTIGAATGEQTLELLGQNLTVSGSLTMGPTAQLYTTGATLTAQLENQGYWYVDDGSVLSGTGFAHVNSSTIETGGDLTINLDGSTFANQGAFVAMGGPTNIVQTGTSPSFTLSGASSLTIGGGRTFTVDGGTFNFEAGSIDGREGTGTLALTNGAVGNFTQAVQTSNVLLSLTDATYNGPGTLTSDNIDWRTYMTNSTVNTVVSNSETIYINDTVTFTGTSFSNTSSGHIYGVGTLDITGTTFSNSGLLDPAGHFDTDPDPDTLTVAGNLTQSATSEIVIHIKQLAPGNVITDVVVVTGSAVLNGGLTAELHVTDTGYVPASGDEFEVMKFASRSGTFGNSTVNVGGVTMNVEYTSTGVWLRVP